MVLRLIGHYDSPFVRRVGVSLHVLGIAFERSLLSVFSDADAMRAFNPLVRVPALVLDDGECLIDSAAILDHLDETGGTRARPAAGRPARPAATPCRPSCSRPASATRPSPSPTSAASPRPRSTRAGSPAAAASRRARWPSWSGGMRPVSPDAARLMQPEITVATMLGYLRLRQPDTRSRRPLPGAGGLVGPRRGPFRLHSLPAERGRDRRTACRGRTCAFALARRRPKPLGVECQSRAFANQRYRGFQPCASITIVMPTST